MGVCDVPLSDTEDIRHTLSYSVLSLLFLISSVLRSLFSHEAKTFLHLHLHPTSLPPLHLRCCNTAHRNMTFSEGTHTVRCCAGFVILSLSHDMVTSRLANGLTLKTPRDMFSFWALHFP